MSEPIRRTARLTRCRCGEHILVGLDGDRCALTARADVYPLSNLGEVEALRSGRWTYRLWSKTLNHRDQWDIRGTAANDTTVLAEHRCGERPPASWCRPITPPAPRRTVDVNF